MNAEQKKMVVDLLHQAAVALATLEQILPQAGDDAGAEMCNNAFFAAVAPLPVKYDPRPADSRLVTSAATGNTGK